MKRRRFGRTGFEVTEISLGARWLYPSRSSKEPATPERDEIGLAVVRAALEAGIDHFDTAPGYPHSERLLGEVIGDRPGEGPKVFRWRNRYWMVVDVWDGLGVYGSDDCEKWTRQEKNLLSKPGQGPDDKVKGGHPDVVVSGNSAFLFYFTHPGRQNTAAKGDLYDQRRSSIQVVELEFKDGEITCDRDKPTHILLQPITDEK